ncbi:MAG: zinc ribbon domain-containing protein [Candidatus Rokubacteria bacterium]|nr:zinc ribbon domain-containing protein [Candidatus Rokubacteria bacterium]
MGAFKCPGCGETTWGALKYCPKCGEPLTRQCPECGGTWRYIYEDDYTFCPGCGARVERARARG